MALNKRTIHDIFRSSKIIGEGSFGQARLYTDRANNTFVIKKCREEVDRDDEMESVWKLQEIEKLNQHPHLNLGGVRSIGRKFIVMPYHGVTLEDWINQCIDEDEETLGYTTCVRLASQLFRTIHDLSSGGFLHGDIRADNVCSKDGRHWVLIDFGLTEKLRPAKQACGPLPYARCFTGPSRTPSARKQRRLRLDFDRANRSVPRRHGGVVRAEPDGFQFRIVAPPTRRRVAGRRLPDHSRPPCIVAGTENKRNLGKL